MDHPLTTNRRVFLSRTSAGLGTMALAQLLSGDAHGASAGATKHHQLAEPHFAPRAKRVIYLFQSGGPSQIDLFDHKPLLAAQHGQELPPEVRGNQRLTTMSANQPRLSLAHSFFKFSRHGQSGATVSELLPHTAKVVDDLCFIRSVHTEAINHDPAITFFQTGSQIAGRPSIGAWLSYGLGTANENLPNFCVMITKGQGGQPLYSRLWGNGFLPSTHQGVQFRSGRDPVLFLSNPQGMPPNVRRAMLDKLAQLHTLEYKRELDPEIHARIEQYEMAYRMQTSIPEVADVSDEPEHIFDLYGPDAKTPGTFAANCLLARRLAERNVRFIQLYHQGWDHHGSLPRVIPSLCKQTDQPCAALITDLKQRGMLDDTLVIWGGEFGRTSYCQGVLLNDNYGRDHHPRCFTMWMAGGGIKPGIQYGKTDEYGYNVVENPVHVHDIQTTLLHLLGIDHKRLTYKYLGREFRLTDIYGNLVPDILA